MTQHDIRQGVQHDTAVVMACDANYAPYALFMAEQIALLHPDRTFDICLFSQDELELPPSLLATGLKLMKMPPGNPFHTGTHADRHGAAAYLRLLIPGEVTGRYRRVLYLDSDIMPMSAGIDQLLGIDLLGAVIGAVRDNVQWRTPGRRVPENRKLGRPASPYFNSGMLLIDVERYRSERILGRCLQVLADSPEAVLRHDQSLLNLALDGHWTELSPVWNWQYTWSSRFFADLVEPKFVHFIGPNKPWRDTACTLPPRFRRAYRTFAQRHYPARTDLAVIDPARRGWPPKLARAYLKHLLSIGAMTDYLNGFDTDLSCRPATLKPAVGSRRKAAATFNRPAEAGVRAARHPVAPCRASASR
ncbi:MAG: glycosyltransferase family 8 protein [Methyloversatilis sp.]|nr:glycosyltransferase family 8 protein [Methyloversatilis sp.]